MLKKNILYISEVASIGGAEISLLELISNLDRQKFNPYFACSEEGFLLEKIKKLGVVTFVVPLHKVRQACFWKFLLSVNKLVNLIKLYDIALVHTNNTRANFIGALAARICKIPAAWHVRNLVAPNFNIDLEKYFFWLPQLIIVNSLATGKRFLFGKNKIFVIYNGVDLEKFNPLISSKKVRSEFLISSCEKIVANVGCFGPGKGQDVFLKAISLVKNKVQLVKFFIVGSPYSLDYAYLESYLKSLARSLGIAEDVIFTGFREDMPEIMAAVDILVSPESNTGHSFGKVLVEAMACAKPVIATDAGGSPEVVQKDITGILVPIRDAASLAQAIRMLLNDSSLADKMGQAGRKRAEQLFDIKQTTRQIEELYLKLLNKSGGED
ncbi:MAG: glycosyltransferase family 4 protein [Candidatus Omnitrophota bacterium]